MSNQFAYDVTITEIDETTRRISGVTDDSSAIKQAKAGKGQVMSSRREKVVRANRVDLSDD